MFETPKKLGAALDTAKKKARLVPVAAEAAFFEHEENPLATPPWEKLAASNISQFERTQALFAILRDAIPDPIFKKITGKRYEYQTDGLPIDPSRYQFESKKIGGGGECMVYKLTALDPDSPSYVIKIDWCSGAQSVDELVARGKQVREECEEERAWYGELPDLIPAELQFIAKSPRGGRNALFTIQEYYGTAEGIHDLFRGYTKEELIALLKSDPMLTATFQTFVRITLEHIETDGRMIDTLGDKNVVLIDRPQGLKELHILDPHAMKNTRQPKNPDEASLIQSDIDFLREVSAALEAKETNL